MKPIIIRVWVPDETPTAAIDGSRTDISTVRDFLLTIDAQSSVQQITEDEIRKIANGIAEREYHSTVRGFVDDLKSEIESGNITDEDGAREYLEQSIDGCHDVIYTYAAQNVVRISSNDSAYFDDFGTDGAIDDSGIQWSKLAYCALLADVMEEIGNLGDLFTPENEDEDTEVTE